LRYSDLISLTFSTHHLNATTSPSADSYIQSSLGHCKVRGKKNLTALPFRCWVGLFALTEGKSFKLLQTSDFLLVAYQVDPELSQEQLVQIAFGVQQLGQGQFPQPNQQPKTT
jgi:hypothetical protein